MAHYFAKSTLGFYDDNIFGARQISVIDPSWVRPTIEIDDPEFNGSIMDGAPIPQVTILDPNAEAPYTFIDNPNCRLPSDAVAITDDEWRAALDGQANGKVITAGDDGKPLLVDYVMTALDRIIELQSSISQRMRDEMALDSQAIDPRYGKTSKQNIIDIYSQIAALRAQMDAK